MADQTQSTENTPIPMSWHEAKREALLQAGVFDQAIKAQMFLNQNEATIRDLTAEIDRLTQGARHPGEDPGGREGEGRRHAHGPASGPHHLAGQGGGREERARGHHRKAASAREEMKKFKAHLRAQLAKAEPHGEGREAAGAMPEPPPGMVAVPLGKGCILVIPERVYLAGLKLGKALRRREALSDRTKTTEGGNGQKTH